MKKFLACAVLAAIGFLGATFAAVGAGSWPTPELWTTGDVIYAEDRSHLTGLAPPGDNYVLRTTGTLAAPAFDLRVDLATSSLTPLVVSADNCQEQEFTVSGVAADDAVSVSGPAATTNPMVTAARATATDTLKIAFCNAGPDDATPAAGTYRFILVGS